jgi:hypothetical protein
MVFPVSTKAGSSPDGAHGRHSSVVWGKINQDVDTASAERVSVARLSRLAERGIGTSHEQKPWIVTQKIRPVYRGTISVHVEADIEKDDAGQAGHSFAASLLRKGRNLLDLAYTCLDLLIDDAQASEL